MSDSLDRLYQAVIAAKDLDPATSRTARLFQRGPAKMAKKLAEEAIEVVIDAVNGNTDAVVRESADLLYNLTVLWASAGVRPDDVWREMDRRWAGRRGCRKNTQTGREGAGHEATDCRAGQSPAPQAALTGPNLHNRQGMDKSGPWWFIAPCSSGFIIGASTPPTNPTRFGSWEPWRSRKARFSRCHPT